MSEKISAICVSHPPRYGLLQRSIYSFAGQDYEDRELLIGICDPDYYDRVSSWLEDSRHEDVDLSNVRVVRTESDPVGHQVVDVFKESSGDHIAVWCDDNLSHRCRLSVHYREDFDTCTCVCVCVLVCARCVFSVWCNGPSWRKHPRNHCSNRKH